ncbi:MAG: sterol desaturase family protein [Spirochaetes bacterium]|nr:sterol desaturase family protein [Spirochaetota bacterium]
MHQVLQYIRDEPTILAIPFYLVTMAVENFLLWRRGRAYGVADTAASLSGGVGSLVVRFFWNIFFVFLLEFFYEHGLKLVGHGWYAWVLLLFLDDFAFYWMHRFSHEVRFLWGTHVVHHSSERYHLATALRQSWTAPLVETPFWLPIAFIGFPAYMILMQMSVSLIYQYWIHTETIRTLGPLEYFMNTPSHHRVHHGSNAEYLDTNYGGIFIFWDRLFGTFVPETAPVRYGLTKNLATHNWFTIQFHEFVTMFRDARVAKNFREKLRQLFASPASLSQAQSLQK